MTIQENDTRQVRQIILEQSAIIFAKNDYVRVRMQDIAQAAGVSRGPLYYYFKNKEELFEATVNYLIAEQKKTYDAIFHNIFPFPQLQHLMIYR